jgi:hypothetical protein
MEAMSIGAAASPGASCPGAARVKAGSAERRMIAPKVDEERNVVVYEWGNNRVEMPIVIGRLEGNGLRVHCPFCKGEHRHSLLEGTRIAHCRKWPRTGAHNGLFGPEYYLRPEGATGRFRGYGEFKPAGSK